MTHFLRIHGETLVMACFVLAGVFLACGVGPTIDKNTVAKDGGKTAYAARQQ